MHCRGPAYAAATVLTETAIALQSSYPFLFLFLPVTCAGFIAIGRWSRPAAAAFLALASLAFYAWWDVRFVPVLAGSVIWNFGAGLAIAHLRRQGRERASRWALAAGSASISPCSVITNTQTSSWNCQRRSARADALVVILPLGISFFTFTQIAFLVDAYRGKVARIPASSTMRLFVTYFPASDRRPDPASQGDDAAVRQAGTYRRSSRTHRGGPDASSHRPVQEGGARRRYRALCQRRLRRRRMPARRRCSRPGAARWPIPCSSISISPAIPTWRSALSRLFGIRLPLNFNSPYKAANIIDFWRRWHMTLSRFLRDYLYIPLGGNRHGKARRYLNLMITMLLGGLWHGAGWTFVIWGGLHGLYLVINHAWRAVKPRLPLAAIPGPGQVRDVSRSHLRRRRAGLGGFAQPIFRPRCRCCRRWPAPTASASSPRRPLNDIEIPPPGRARPASCRGLEGRAGLSAGAGCRLCAAEQSGTGRARALPPREACAPCLDAECRLGCGHGAGGLAVGADLHERLRSSFPVLSWVRCHRGSSRYSQPSWR